MNYKTKRVILDFLPGSEIKDACAEAYAKLCHEECDIEFNFNGVKVTFERAD